eukprot:4748452-Pleurochrysis_carterae.AAC.1
MNVVVSSGGVNRQATRPLIGKSARRFASAPRDDSPFEQPAPSVQREHETFPLRTRRHEDSVYVGEATLRARRSP